MTHLSRLTRILQKSAVTGALLMCFLWGVSGWAQRATPPPLPLGSANQQQNRDDDVAWQRQQRELAAKEENLQRQAEIKKEAAQLLQLATELKQYVDKTNEHTLSLDVIKKADQIEKLAKSVKDKMKGP